ncbi:uncharacterized protein LOC111305754 isoform X2 [Durio zibethinus]|nr:uncharacterized protein LOC111305754 isoform X2 [Durio zibethinus]
MGSWVLQVSKACAQAFQDGNLILADHYMACIWDLAVMETDENKSKLIKYFAEALVRRAYGLRPTIPYPTSFMPGSNFYRTLQLVTGTATRGKRQVHIIDFLSMLQPDIGTCYGDWLLPDVDARYCDLFSVLMQAILPRSFRLSVIVSPLLKNAIDVGGVGRNLTCRAKLVNVTLEFQVFKANSLGDLDESFEFRRAEDEAVVISYRYKLHRLLAESGSMERELLRLRQIKPDNVIIVEQSASDNDFNFIERLERSFESYSCIFGKISNSSCDLLDYHRQGICSSVGCEGMVVMDPHETVAQFWGSRLQRAGFLLFPLQKPGLFGLHVQEENGCLIVNLEESPPVVISVWKFTKSMDNFSSNSVQDSHQNFADEGLFPTVEVFPEGFSLNRIAALAEIYDLSEDICLRYELPLALTWTLWANVKHVQNEITPDLQKKHTFSIQSTACYVNNNCASKEFMEICVRQPHLFLEGQAIAGKVLQLNESLFVSDIRKFDMLEYPFANAASKFGYRDVVAINLLNNFVGGDSCVLEFYLPSSTKNFEEQKLLEDRIFFYLKNVKKTFVTPRVHGTGLGFGEATISNIPQMTMPVRSSPPAPTIGNLVGTGVSLLQEDSIGVGLPQEAISNTPVVTQVAMPMASSPPAPATGPLLVGGTDFLQEAILSTPVVTQVLMPTRSTPPASTISHSFNLNVNGLLNTAEPRDDREVGTQQPHEQGVKKKDNIFEPIPDIDPENVKANRDISILPRTKQRKSMVWEHFDRVWENGSLWAKCKHCNKSCTGSSKSGTTHLKNHLDRCPVKKSEYQDMQLKFPAQSTDLTILSAKEGSPIFDPERSRLDFEKLIIKLPYVLDMAEDESFKNFLNNLQPRFEIQPRESILSNIYGIYEEEKEKLRHYFDQLACNISLTIRLLKDNLRKNVYCCLIANFVDDDWELKKKILAFKILDYIYDAKSLSTIIQESVSEWNIRKKVCSIVLDDFPLNDNIVEHLKENCLSGQISLPSDSCYINCTLIQDGLYEIDDVLQNIRKSVEYVNETPFGRLKFQDAVNQVKLQGGKLRDDSPLRLDSNFDMLDWALESREVFCQLEQNDGNFRTNPSMKEWDRALVMHRFLKGFYDTLSSSGGAQSLTPNLYFPKLCDMYKKLLQLEKGNYPCMKLMKMKFEKYWNTYNLIFAIAAVLDPRLKFRFVEFSFGEIYQCDSKMQLSKFYKLLMDVYYEYANEGSNLSRPASIFSDFSCSTTQSANDSMLKSFSRYASASNFNDVASWKSDIDCYLEEPLLPLVADGELFDVLGWWRINKLKFPTLGRMARDILAIPVSVVPLDSSFNTLVTNLNYSGLGPNFVEAFICCQDWLVTPKRNGKTEHVNVQITAKRKMEEKGSYVIENHKHSKYNAEETNNQATDKASYKMLDEETTCHEEINMTEHRTLSEKDIQAYLVSPFTQDEAKQIKRWESSRLSG